MEHSRFSINTSAKPRGFTLVEMIVVLAIIVIITAVVLNSQNDFNRSLTITDTAYTVALSIREAQTFGLSSRTYSPTATQNAAYGAHFTRSSPKGYLLFADVFPGAPGTISAYCPGHTAVAGSPDAKPGNCTYDASQNETAQNFTFGRGFQITNICGHDTSNTLRCTSTGYLTGIDIVFLRPNTDSVVVGLTAGTGTKLLDAQVTLTAPSGNGSRSICVTQAGEISVATSTCP